MTDKNEKPENKFILITPTSHLKDGFDIEKHFHTPEPRFNFMFSKCMVTEGGSGVCDFRKCSFVMKELKKISREPIDEYVKNRLMGRFI